MQTIKIAMDVVKIKGAVKALSGLGKVLDDVAQGVKEAFAVRGYQDYLQTVRRFGKDLADELLVLQMAFGRLKVAIAQAVSPIAEVFVPMINDAIFALIRFAGTVRQFFAAFFAGIGINTKAADSTDQLADSQNNLEKATSSAGRAARRSLMSFDQLNRLSAPSGGGSGGGGNLLPDSLPLEISPKVQALVDKLLALLRPLMEIDLSPLGAALERAKEALAKLAEVIGPALEWLWYEILTPFAAWVMEVLAPALVEGWAAGMEAVAALLGPVLEGMKALWEGIKPIVEFIGTVVIEALEAWTKSFEGLAQLFRERGPEITQIFQNIAQVVRRIWEIISPILQLLRQDFQETFGFIGKLVVEAVGVIIQALGGITGFLVNVFSGNWSQAWQDLTGTLRTVVNGIIGLLNAMLSRLGSALNKVIGAANSLSFTVPEWVPGIGGKHFGVNMRSVSVPQIPYLAQGAVLPANKPFLAMVGDQRHGTNVEAPLATIQEAVAVVMEDVSAGNMAGHRATVELLQKILEAVLGIRIGDDTIAAAVERHRLQSAMLCGR